MRARRLAAILLAAALLVGLLPAISAAGPSELQLLAPEGQTAIKGGDTVRVDGTADADADVQDETLIAVDEAGATLATFDVAGLISNDAGVLSASFILGCGLIPGCPDDPALRQRADGYRIEARVVSAADDLQVVSPVLEFDEVDPNILSYSLIRDADGGASNLIEVRFDEDVADPQGDTPSDWTIDGLRQVLSISGEGDRRVLMTLLEFAPDATPFVRYEAQTGIGPTRPNQPYLDEAGNDLTARRNFSLAADRIAPEPPTIDAIDGTATTRDGEDQAVPVLGSDDTPVVTVGSMTDGHTARVFLDDGDGTLEDDRDTLVGEAVASGGVAEVAWPEGLALPDATHRLFARALDDALCDPNRPADGTCPNASARSQDALYDLDTTAPTLVDPALASTSAITVVVSESVTGPTEPADWTVTNPDGSPGPAVTGVSGSGDARVLQAASVLPNSTLTYAPAGARFVDEHGNALEDATIDVIAAPIPVARLVDAAAVDELDGPSGPLDVTYEENEAAFRIELSDPVRPGETATITLEVVGVDATADDDFTDPGQFTVALGEGESGADVPVELVGDELDEPDETFELRVVSTNEFVAVADGTATGTITDDDPLAALSVADVTVTEGAVAAVTASLDTASGKDVVADWSLQPDTASPDADYEAASGSLTIPAGETSVTVDVTTFDDDLDEPDAETLSLVIDEATATAVTVVDGEAVVTINDDDPLPTVRVADLRTFEGDDTRLVQLVFTLSEVSGRDVEVTYATSDGTAEAGSDYTAATDVVTIPAGAASTTVDLEILGDTTPEGDEDLTITLSSPSNATVDDATATVVLVEDDGGLPPVTLGLAPGEADEGDPGPFSLLFPEQVVWTLTLSAPLDTPLEVAYRTTEDGTATAGDDFQPDDDTVTIPANTTSVEIPIDLESDTLYEGDETITLEIDDPVRVDLTNGDSTLAADGTILDDDPLPTVAFADGSEAQVVEEGETATFTVELDVVSGLPASVDWALDFDGAATTADLADQSATVDIPAGDTTATFTVTTIDDGDDEPDETVSVVLADPVDAALADDRPTTSQLTLADNEVVVPTLTVTGGTVDEGDGLSPLIAPELEFTFTLDQPTPVDVTASWRTTGDGTATPGSDFDGSSGTVTIEANTTTTTIPVATVIDDDLDEFTEEVTVVVSEPTNARLEGGVDDLTEIGRITDDDEPVTVDIGDDATVTEGDLATFDVTLDAESGKTVIVSYTTVDDDATAGEDYTATSGELEFAPGTTTQSITVVTTDDTDDEPAEDLRIDLTLETEDAATLGNASATLTIDDNDVPVDPTRPPVVGLSGDAVEEGDPLALPLPSPATPLTFEVRLSETPDSTVTVSYTTRPGTATADEDFTSVTGTVEIGTDEDRAEITVDVLPDAIDEADEELELVITDVTGDARLPDGSDELARTGRILDDDPLAVLGFTEATLDVGVSEGGSVQLTVERTGETSRTVSADWTLSYDGGASAADAAPQSGTVVIEPDQSTASFEVATTQDDLDEPNEAFSVVLSSPDTATLDPDTDVATVTIADDDLVLPVLSVDGGAVDEGEAGSPLDGFAALAPAPLPGLGAPLVFTLTLSEAAEVDVLVDWTTTDIGTAVAGTDYTAASGTVTIPAGETSATVEVDVLDDDLDEFDEVVIVRFSNLRNARFPDGASRLDEGGRITDDDPLVTVDLGDDVEVTEGDPATFDVTLSAASGKDISLRLVTSDGSARAGQDYRATSRTITIPAGETTATVTVPTLDDSAVESTEDATISLEVVNADTAALGRSTATLSIADDDVVPTDPDTVVVSLSGDAVDEGDPFALPLPLPTGSTLEFVISLSNPADGDVTLDYETRAGTATSGDDYTATNGQVTIPDGASEATVSVPVTPDAIDEFDEDLTLALTAVSGDAVLPGGELERTGRILDDDAAAQLRVSDATVLEGSAAELDVTLDTASGKDITVAYRFVDGTATAGADYVTASGTLEFPAGTTSRTVSVATLADGDTGELIEQFELVLSAPTNAALDDPRGTVSIVDIGIDGLPTVTAVFLEDVTTVEADGDRTALVPVRLSAESSEDVTVTWSSQRLTAADGEDYRAEGGQVVIPAGATSAQIPVTIIGDDEVEPNEDFLVLLTQAEGAVITGPTGRVTIEDDDDAADGAPGGGGGGGGDGAPDGGDDDGVGADDDLAATGGGAGFAVFALGLLAARRRRREDD